MPAAEHALDRRAARGARRDRSATTGSAASGAGISRSQAAVTIPSVPSEPISRRLQVVAGDVLAHRAADRRSSSPGGTTASRPVTQRAGDAVLEGVRAAGVRGDVAADLRLLGGARVGREQQAVLAREAPQLARAHARLDVDPPQQRVERAHARHAGRARRRRRRRPAPRRRRSPCRRRAARSARRARSTRRRPRATSSASAGSTTASGRPLKPLRLGRVARPSARRRRRRRRSPTSARSSAIGARVM